MSVVVAIKENGKVTIGADSQCTRGGTRRTHIRSYVCNGVFVMSWGEFL